jgi:hypothetical protein
MKEQNSLFVDLVSSIFLLVLLIGNFMGLLYITEGNIVISMMGSLFLVVCYFFVVRLLAKNKEVMLKNKFAHASLLFWVFFLVLAYVSFNLMSHFINIEYNCKAQIKKEATHKIKLVDSLAVVYEKRAKDDMQNFEAKLKKMLAEYKTTESRSLRTKLAKSPYMISLGVLDDAQYNVREVAKSKVDPMQDKIKKNILNIKNTIKLNSKKYQSVFDNWKRMSLVATYSKLNEYVDESVKQINGGIEKLPLDNEPIVVKYDTKILPLNDPGKLNKAFPPKYTLPLIIILIVHLFILLPFFLKQVTVYGTGGRTRTEKGSSGNTPKGTIEH